jgi:heptosyltransferase-2
MPGAAWTGKQWPAERYARALSSLGTQIVVLGAETDRASVALVTELKKLGVECVSGVGRWSLPQVAHVLSRSQGLVGNDTGLAHLAESLGVRVFTIFGPTVPEMGFGPRLTGSRAEGLSLWCRPCSKDGRGCHRVIRRHACLTDLPVEQVEASLREWVNEGLKSLERAQGSGRPPDAPDAKSVVPSGTPGRANPCGAGS